VSKFATLSLSQVVAIDHQNSGEQFSPEVTEEGISIIENFLQSWASARDGEDTHMSNTASAETQMEELKVCYEKFRPKIESNAWVQSIISSL
jgi:DNA mismatch repair protein MSH2